MVNALVSTWAPRAKFVDDLTVLVIVPRNSLSLLGYVIMDIQSYDCNMRLDPAKCKEMSISFLMYDSCVWQPISIGGLAVRCRIFQAARDPYIAGPYLGSTLRCRNQES